MSNRLPAWLTLTNAAEAVAALAVLIKVYQIIAKPDDPLRTNLDYASVALLFLSIYVMLRQVGKGLSTLDVIANELERRDGVGRYGVGAAAVASLLDLARRQGNYAHSQSGGRILSHLLLEVFTDAAHDLSSLAKGQKKSVTLIEYHVVDRFVHELIDSLPTGSAWSGVSRLQDADAWRQQTAHVDFHHFQKAVENRCRTEQVNYLRLWCFDEESDRREMASILEEQSKHGLVQRWLVDKSATDDFSLIWTPKRALSRRTKIRDLEAPMNDWDSSASELVPLCPPRSRDADVHQHPRDRDLRSARLERHMGRQLRRADFLCRRGRVKASRAGS